MATATSKTFKSGNSVAVRLPKEIALKADVEVVINRVGDTLTIKPKRQSVQDMMTKLLELPGPSRIQKRDIVMAPKRRGL